MYIIRRLWPVLVDFFDIFSMFEHFLELCSDVRRFEAFYMLWSSNFGLTAIVTTSHMQPNTERQCGAHAPVQTLR